jgi:Tfp pilus assembly protein PilO
MRSNNENNTFWAILAILITIGGFAYSWKTLMPKYKATQTALANVEADINAINNKSKSISEAKSTLGLLSASLQKLYVSMPKEKDLANLYAELEAIAAATKTSIPTLQFGGSDTSNEIAFSVSVEGSFADMSNFIKIIENNEKFMNIKSASVAQPKDKMTLSLQIVAYKQVVAAAATGATSSTTGGDL